MCHLPRQISASPRKVDSRPFSYIRPQEMDCDGPGYRNRLVEYLIEHPAPHLTPTPRKEVAPLDSGCRDRLLPCDNGAATAGTPEWARTHSNGPGGSGQAAIFCSGDFFKVARSDGRAGNQPPRRRQHVRSTDQTGFHLAEGTREFGKIRQWVRLVEP
jgi:hypothetical protein